MFEKKHRSYNVLYLVTALALSGCGGGGSPGGNLPPDNPPDNPLDTTPNAFVISPILNALPDADYVIDVALTGLDPGVQPVASINGEGCDSITLALDPQGNEDGRTLNVALRTPVAFEATLNCTIDVSGVTAALTVTTGRNEFAHAVGPGSLDLSWAPFAGVTAYQLTRSNPVTGAEAVVATVPGETDAYSLPIHGHLVDWINDRFTLSACTGKEGCESFRSIPAHDIASLGQALSAQATTYAKASNTDGADSFGEAVSISGDTLAVGAVFESSASVGVNGDQADNSLAFAGAVYVFRRVDNLWTQEAYVKASQPGQIDVFGQHLVLSGNVLAVGARFEDSAAAGINGNDEDNSANDSGAVYVFRRVDGAWGQEAYLKASNTGSADNFGASLALTHDDETGDDILAVGAPGEDSQAIGIGGDETDDSAANSGAVYVYRHSEGAWTQEAYIKASNTGEGDSFGFSTALAGNLLAVGAVQEDSVASGIGGDEDDDSSVNSGAVYLLQRDGGQWAQIAYVKASNPDSEDRFGHRVSLAELPSAYLLAVSAISEDSAAVGVNGDQSDNSASSSGAAYLFDNANTLWEQTAYLKASNSASDSRFGSSLAFGGNTLAVGAFGESSASTGINGAADDTTSSESGAVYVFRLSDSIPEQAAYVKASNTGRDDRFGGSAALSEDGTLVVGAPAEDSQSEGINGDQTDNSKNNSGAVYIY